MPIVRGVAYVLFSSVLLAPVGRAVAQSKPEEAGFKATAPAFASGTELTQQPNLWMMEVRFKPMRMITADITNPETGEKERTLIWYVVYQAVNRPLVRPDDKRDTRPRNDLDPPTRTPLFVPEFTLVTTDSDGVSVYHDEVLPEAQARIAVREKKRYLNSAEVVGPIPAETPYDAIDEEVVEGVAMFRNIDPRTDFFALLATGFSNGFVVSPGPDGEPIVSRKTIHQKYWRPGDAFSQNEGEFRFRGEPGWIYRPEEPTDPLAGLEPAEADAPDAPQP